MIEKTILTIPILEALEKAKGCPLCFIWSTNEKSCGERMEANEVSMDQGFREKVITAAGFCNRHMHLLFQLSFSGHTENGLGYALYTKDVLDNLEGELRGLNVVDFLPAKTRSKRQAKEISRRVFGFLEGSAKCPMCEILLDSDERAIRTFLSMLKDRTFAAHYAESEGICFPHFTSALALLAREKNNEYDSVMTPLFRVQLNKLAEIRMTLDNRIRKYAWDHHDEPLSQEEANSQRTALGMIAGDEGLYCRERKVSLSD